MKRVVVLGRGGAGKTVLARQLGEMTGLPVVELDALFWQQGLVPMSRSRWAWCQRELARRPAWILDGDLGPYDAALDVRMRAADAIVVLDFGFPRCAWRSLRRGRERADYWRWVWAYRRGYLSEIMRAVTAAASGAEVHVLRNPAMVRRFIAEVRQRQGG